MEVFVGNKVSYCVESKYTSNVTQTLLFMPSLQVNLMTAYEPSNQDTLLILYIVAYKLH